MKRLSTFAFVDDTGVLNIDVRAMLVESGVPDTPGNRDRACQVLVKLARQMLPNAEIVAVDGGGRQN